MCVALKSVEDKSNEIPAVQQLIDMLDLAGAVVTADAMHCQRETAEKIVAKEADFVLMVKGNQETLQAELQSLWHRESSKTQTMPIGPWKLRKLTKSKSKL